MTRHTPWQKKIETKKIETLYKKHKEVYISKPPLSPFRKGGFAQSIMSLFYKEGYIQSIVPLLYEEVSESLNILPLFYKEGLGEITHYDL